MDILNTIKAWAKGLAEVGVSIAALAIILEILGLSGAAFGFGGSVVTNVSAMIAGLGAQGLVGLVAIYVLYQIWDKR